MGFLFSSSSSSSHSILVWWLMLLLVSCCHGSRTMQAFKERPLGRRSPNYFLGFLPRGMPIPPSGPSRQHNSIGALSHSPP